MEEKSSGMEAAEKQLKILEQEGNFEIRPYEGNLDISRNGLTKLSLSSEQKIQMGGLLSQVPSMMAAGTLANTYVATFPDGLNHTLVKLKQGGYGSMYQENGKWAGTASLYSTKAMSVCLTAISVMAVVSGQYYLSEINNKLKMINLNLDKILEFLYGDKKAELLAEVNFVKYAYQNFGSMVLNDIQCTATISSLQRSRNVAMKDIEFYIGDLDAEVNRKSDTEIGELINRALQIKESLDLSIQLYLISNMLEVYYSGNRNPDYLQYIERDVSSYIDKCEKRMLACFSVLKNYISDYKGRPWKKNEISHAQEIAAIVDHLNTGEESDLRKLLHNVLYADSKNRKCYISRDGDVFIPTSPAE